MNTQSDPTTKAELRAALDDLVLQAHANGVEVDNGGYVLRHPESDIPDWEVLITRTTKMTDHGK